jgi:hypothetical protein
VEEKPPAPLVPEKTPVVALPYATAGSMEVGAWVGMAASTSSIEATLGGIFGWFFAKGFEVSGVAGVAYLHPGTSAVTGTLLVEPSIHVPMASGVLGFAGLGGGISLSPTGVGFEMSQRVGVNVLLGSHQVLTPSLSLTYATNVPSTTAVGGAVGYAVTW